MREASDATKGGGGVFWMSDTLIEALNRIAGNLVHLEKISNLFLNLQQCSQ